MAVHVLDHLYKKLNEVWPVQGARCKVVSLLPNIEVLDSWLYEGTLDDPFEEMFFYSNKDISIDEAEFWEKSYLLRPIQYQKFDVNVTAATCANDRLSLKTGKKETAGRESISKGKEWSNGDFVACPLLFIRDIAKSIVSAGKSLQLIRHVPTLFPTPSTRGDGCTNDVFRSSNHGSTLSEFHRGSIAGLTLSEVFCVSLAGLIGHGDRISERFCRGDVRMPKIVFSFESHLSKQRLEKVDGESLSDLICLEKTWFKFLVDTLSGKRVNDSKSKCNEASDLSQTKEENMAVGVVDELPFLGHFSQTFLTKMRDA